MSTPSPSGTSTTSNATAATTKCGERGGAEPRDPYDEGGQLGVGGGDGQQFRRRACPSRRPRGSRALSGDLDPHVVCLLFHCGVRQAGAGSVGEGEDGEEDGETGEREQQRAHVPGGDRAVDDHADGDRYEGLGGLVGAEQRDAGHPRGRAGGAGHGAAPPRR